MDYIYFTIQGTATVARIGCHFIVYGIKEWSDTIDPRIYDLKSYVSEDSNMKMLTKINMDNNRIIYLGEPIYDTDASTKLFVDTSINNLNTTIRTYVNTSLQNYTTKSYVDTAIRNNTPRINTALIGIPILNGMTLAIIPSLTQLDVNESDKISGITDSVGNRKFSQSDNIKKPTFNFDSKLGKYYAKFHEFDHLPFGGFPTADIGGSSGKTSTIFVLTHNKDDNPKYNFEWGDQIYLHTVPSTDEVEILWASRTNEKLYLQNVTQINNKIILWTIRASETGSNT